MMMMICAGSLVLFMQKVIFCYIILAYVLWMLRLSFLLHSAPTCIVATYGQITEVQICLNSLWHIITLLEVLWD